MKNLILALVFMAASVANGALIITGNVSISGNVTAVVGSLAAPAIATNIFPANTQEHILSFPSITWTYGAGATSFNLYLDKESDANPPTTLVESGNVLTFDASGLDYNTDYVYRVDAVNSVGTTPGNVIAFKTAVPTVCTTIMRLGTGTDETLLTPTELTAGTFGAGTWTVSPDPMTDVYVDTAQHFTAYAVEISGGTGNGGPGETRSIRCDNTANTQRASIELGQHPTLTVGFPLRLGPGFGSTSLNMDFVVIESGDPIDPPPGETNDFSTINWQDNTRRAKAHTIAGKATGVNIPLNNKWYWATMLWDAPNLITKIRFYDPETTPWTLVGESELALLSFNAHRIRFGHVDNTSGFINSPHWFGDILIDSTGAKWPLVPDESGL